MPTADATVERLAAALEEERAALVGGDAGDLLRATQQKLAALGELEARADTATAARLSARIATLAELNRANGALLARRRREVNWALRHLGRMESSPAYDASGRAERARGPRDLAVA